MGAEERTAVVLVFSPDAELIPVAEGLVSGLAEQMGFAESARMNLQQGVGRACRRLLEGARDSGELRVQCRGFADRVEIILEDGGAADADEADTFLLTQLLDRVSVEDTGEGRQRVTLVKYLSDGGG